MYKTCKTEASIARQREIEDALLLAMGQLAYDRITLNQLCEALGMPRKSLYRYFPTKQDILLGLIDHRLSDCNALVFSDWQGSRQFDKASLGRFFSYWMAQKPFLDAVSRNDLWPLILDRTTWIVDAMKAAEPGAQSFARDQVEYFIAHGLMSTVLRWHHLGYPSPPEEMAKIFASVLCSPELSISRLL